MILSALAYRVRHRQRLAWMEELAAEQWLPPIQLQESADNRTRELAVHVGRHVPYYQQVFAELHIAPESLRIPEGWAVIPTLDKDTLRRRYADLISVSPHGLNSYVNHTGGSTGVPVQFLTDNQQLARMGAWLDFVSTWAGWRPGELRLEIWGNKPRQLPPTKLQLFKASLSGSFSVPVYHYTENDLYQWWKVVVALRPTILYGYPSVMANFASWINSEQKELPKIKGIFSSAEVLYPEQRNLIEKVFRCKVYNQYGSRETPCVACECPEGSMHLFINWNVIEFLDVGEEVNGGKEIIITPLFNFAQPLLRYRIGDLGRLSDKQCSCGRGYPVMDLNVARSGDFLLGENGTRFYPSLFTHLMDGKSWVRAFQFVQEAKSKLTLNVVPETTIHSEPLRSCLQNELTVELRKIMGGSLDLSVKLVESIDRTKAGKHRYVVNAIESNGGV